MGVWQPPVHILACLQCSRIPHGRHWPGVGSTGIGTGTAFRAARIVLPSIIISASEDAVTQQHLIPLDSPPRMS